MDKKYNYKIEKQPKCEVKIEMVIDSSLLPEARKKAVRDLSNQIEVDGFRKGNVPENIVVQRIGEGNILQDSAEILINEYFPKIIIDEKLDMIGQPTIAIKKLALGNDIELEAKFAVMPEIKLGNYKAIAQQAKSASLKSQEEPKVTEKEIDDVLMQIRKNKAHFDYHKNNPEDKDHDKHPDFSKEENLPPLDDELAKAAGNFKNVEDLKEKIKENIIEDKKSRNSEKARAQIMEELIKETSFEMPEILVESEMDKSVAQVKDDVARMGGNFEEYLGHIKKTEEELRKEMREPAEKRGRIQLILNEIAKAEKITPDETILESETKKILELYPGAKEENARIYVATQLINAEVLKLLENQ
jgi:trigger factor